MADISLNINGAKVLVEITRRGWFTAEYDGADFEAESLKALEAKLTKATRVKLADLKVPFSIITSANRYGAEMVIKHGICRGLNQQNQHPLVTYDDGEKGTVSGYGEKVLRRLTDAEIADWIRLREARDAALSAYEGWVNERQINLQVQIKTALEAL